MANIKSHFFGGGINNTFKFVVKTDNTGTSNNDQFTIPTSTGTYLYDITTSDGYSATGLTGNHTITFPSGAGTHTIMISGAFPYIYFNDSGDKLKIIDLQNFGIYATLSTSQLLAFRGCNNLVISASDIGNFEDVTSFIGTWNECSSMTSFPLIDTSSGTNFTGTWFNCSSLTSFPLIDTSSSTIFASAWRGCSSLTSFPLIDISNGTNFNFAWNNCTSLTSFPLNFFDNCLATNFSDAFDLTNLSQASIDGILVSINSNGTSNGTFNQSGGSAPSATGLAAKTSLEGRGWTVIVTT
jgi:hypothetical protein